MTRTRTKDTPPADPVRARYHWSNAGPKVETPGGPGILWQTFDSRVGVILDTDPRHVAFFTPEHVQVVPERASAGAPPPSSRGGRSCGPLRAAVPKVSIRESSLMDFKASNSTGSGDSYEKPAPGTYTGVLQGFAGCGTHADSFNEGKSKKRCMLRWELHKRRGPSVDSQGRIHTVTCAFTASLHEKAKLRQIVEAHIGVMRNDDRTTSQEWLGKPVKLTIRDSDDGNYANVFSASPFDAEEEECQPPDRELPSEHWEIDKDGRDGVPCPRWAEWLASRSKEWDAVEAACRTSARPDVRPGPVTPTRPSGPLTAVADEGGAEEGAEDGEDPDIPF